MVSRRIERRAARRRRGLRPPAPPFRGVFGVTVSPREDCPGSGLPVRCACLAAVSTSQTPRRAPDPGPQPMKNHHRNFFLTPSRLALPLAAAVVLGGPVAWPAFAQTTPPAPAETVILSPFE